MMSEYWLKIHQQLGTIEGSQGTIPDSEAIAEAGYLDHGIPAPTLGND